MSILFPRRKEKTETCSKLNAFTVIEKTLLPEVSSESEGVKKLLMVLVTSTPVTVAREEEIGENLGANLARVSCLRYHINFGKKSVSILLDSSSEVNAVHPAFAKELGLPIKPTDVGAQKIDGTTLETYRMVVAALLVEDKAN